LECRGEIGFHDAQFWHSYSGGDSPLLKGVTFTIKPGQTIGIVGSSESGKSTYLDLIMRLFDAQNGTIVRIIILFVSKCPRIYITP
jgi:ABC-type multidrug transport system fused ATPase/permease subunit